MTKKAMKWTNENGYVEGRDEMKTLWVATWNVRGTFTEGAMRVLVGQLRKYTVDIIALQETKQKGTEVIDIEDYTFFGSGGENRRFGTGFMIHNRIKQAVIQFKPITDRMCYIRVRGKHRKLSFINVHAPTEEKDEDEKNEFYENIEKLYEEIPKYDIKMVLGDFNAKLGREEKYIDQS